MATEWGAVEIFAGCPQTRECSRRKVVFRRKNASVAHACLALGAVDLVNVLLCEARNGCFRALPHDKLLAECVEDMGVGSTLVLRPNVVLLGATHRALWRSDAERMALGTGMEMDEMMYAEAVQKFKCGFYRAASVVEAGQLVGMSFLVNCVPQWKSGDLFTTQRLSSWIGEHAPESVCGRAGSPAVLSQALSTCHELYREKVSPHQIRIMYIKSIREWCAKVYLGEFFECNQVHFSSATPSAPIDLRSSGSRSKRRSKAVDPDDLLFSSSYQRGQHGQMPSPRSISSSRRHTTSWCGNGSVVGSPSRRRRKEYRKVEKSATLASEIAASAGKSLLVFPVTWFAVNCTGLHILYTERLHRRSGTAELYGAHSDGYDEYLEEEMLKSFHFSQIDHWSCSPDGNVVALCIGSSGEVIHLSGVSNSWARNVVSLLSVFRHFWEQRIPADVELTSALYDIFQIPPISKDLNLATLRDYCKIELLETNSEVTSNIDPVPDINKLNSMKPTEEIQLGSSTTKETDLEQQQMANKDCFNATPTQMKALILFRAFDHWLKRRNIIAARRCLFVWRAKGEEKNERQVSLFRKARERNILHSHFRNWCLLVWRKTAEDNYQGRIFLCTKMWRKKILLSHFRSWSSHVSKRKLAALRIGRKVQQQESNTSKLLLAFSKWASHIQKTRETSYDAAARKWSYFSISLLEHRLSEYNRGYQDGSRVAKAAFTLAHVASRRSFRVLKHSFGIWHCSARNAGLHSLARAVFKVVEGAFRIRIRAALRAWKRWVLWNADIECWWTVVNELLVENRVRVVLRRCWSKWKKVTSQQGRREKSIQNGSFLLWKTYTLSKLLRNWRRWCGATKVVSLTRKHLLLRCFSSWKGLVLACLAIERLLERKFFKMQQRCFHKLRENLRQEQVFELSDIVSKIERRILLQRGVNSWKKFVMLVIVRQGTALASLTRIFSAYEANMQLKTLRVTFDRWKEISITRYNANLLSEVVEAACLRTEMRKGFERWKRFILVCEAERSFGIQKITSVLSDLYNRTNSESMRRAFVLWQSSTRFLTLATFVQAASERVLMTRGMSRWKQFVMAREAESTYGIHIIVTVFQEYLRRDELFWKRQAMERWVTFVKSCRVVAFGDIGEISLRRIRLRGAMSQWRRFVITRSLEEGFAIDTLSRVFYRYEASWRLQNAFKRWLFWSCEDRNFAKIRNFRTIQNQRLQSRVMDKWVRLHKASVERKREGTTKLLEAFEYVTKRATFLMWVSFTDLTRRMEILTKLSACQESIGDLRLSCKMDLDSARRLHSQATSTFAHRRDLQERGQLF